MRLRTPSTPPHSLLPFPTCPDKCLLVMQCKLLDPISFFSCVDPIIDKGRNPCNRDVQSYPTIASLIDGFGRTEDSRGPDHISRSLPPVPGPGVMAKSSFDPWSTRC
ncbi:hypothetical protein RRG08_029218 [Elysia crispata]|uniref:Uncharacterized protein n=1 Tax=Elysia crispata TaxID=231223 RepID=A0AAE1AJ48_9GAST|nr:hypothetical protein RRG08_029218 [Elysia crispata]